MPLLISVVAFPPRESWAAAKDNGKRAMAAAVKISALRGMRDVHRARPAAILREMGRHQE